MPDRLRYAIDYAKQDLWVLPCTKGTKHASIRWKHLERRAMTVYERHDGWPPRGDQNIALICGRRAGLLVLNVNVKNGHDGPGTLQRLGWIIPPTPTIRTPSGGLAYCFQAPDRDLYPFPFDTHVHPPDYEGLEFRGGDDHYQLVPPSRTTDGRYTFVPPWTVDRFRADLAELPEPILHKARQRILYICAEFTRLTLTVPACRAIMASGGRVLAPNTSEGQHSHLRSYIALTSRPSSALVYMMLGHRHFW